LHNKYRKGISEYLGFLLAVIIIIVVLIPLLFLMSDLNSPGEKPQNQQGVINKQINGGGVLIYFNSSVSPQLLVLGKYYNYTLTEVFVNNGSGVWYNITKLVVTIRGNYHLPLQLIYNFSLPRSAFNSQLTLHIIGLNTSVLISILPNETAVAS
jgi:hypothetical protein